MPCLIHGCATDIALPKVPARSVSPILLLLRQLIRRRLVLISLFILLIVLVAAVGAPWLAPYSPRKMDIAHRLAAPSAGHWFGTDEFGRPILTEAALSFLGAGVPPTSPTWGNMIADGTGVHAESPIG